MPETMGLQLCFDELGREIEILEVTPVARDKYRIEETSVFNPGIALGDIIRVKEKQGISYYIETVQKSGFIRYAWLLSKEASTSREITIFKRHIKGHAGRWEQIFGGLLVIHMPPGSLLDVEGEMARIIERFEL